MNKKYLIKNCKKKKNLCYECMIKSNVALAFICCFLFVFVGIPILFVSGIVHVVGRIEGNKQCNDGICLDMPGYKFAIDDNSVTNFNDERIYNIKNPCDAVKLVFETTFHCKPKNQPLKSLNDNVRVSYVKDFDDGVFVFSKIDCGTSLHRVYKTLRILHHLNYKDFQMMQFESNQVIGLIQLNNKTFWLDPDYGVCVPDKNLLNETSYKDWYSQIYHYNNWPYHDLLIKKIIGIESFKIISFEHLINIGKQQEIAFLFPLLIVIPSGFLILAIMFILFAALITGISLIINKIKSYKKIEYIGNNQQITELEVGLQLDYIGDDKL